MSSHPVELSLSDKLKLLKLKNQRKKLDTSGTSHSEVHNKENSLLSSSITQRQNKTAPAGSNSILHNSTSESNASLHGSSYNSSADNGDPIAHCVDRIGAKRSTVDRTDKRRMESYLQNVPPTIAEEPAKSVNLSKCKSTSDVTRDREEQNRSMRNASMISMSSSSLHNHELIYINNRPYRQLKQIGRGGSSKVFEVLDEMTRDVVAVKIVDLSNETAEVRDAFQNEIALLRSLQGSPHVIVMHDYELTDDQLFVVLEKGDTDLSTFIKERREKVDAAFIRYFWREMLSCVKVVHDKNILHSDLKPANFLMVKGHLKLIDFGIASSIPSNKTSVIKDCQMGTLNYMSPECIRYTEDGRSGAGYKIPLKSDVWALGCILYTMVYGSAPFAAYKTQFQKMNAIGNPEIAINFPPLGDQHLLDTLKKCLCRNVDERASVYELLAHPYCTDQPREVCPSADVSAMAEELLKHTPRTTFRMLQEMVSNKSASTRTRSSSHGANPLDTPRMRLQFE